MTLKQDDVAKIAHLARLEIEPEEIKNYAQELSKILELVEQINQADTKGIKPMAHPLEDMVQRFREDAALEQPDREKYQQIAPSHEAGLYLVPQVIGEE